MTYLQLKHISEQYHAFLKTYQLQTARAAEALLQVHTHRQQYRFISDKTARKVVAVMQTLHSQLEAETRQRDAMPNP